MGRIDPRYDPDRWRLVCTQDPWPSVVLPNMERQYTFRGDPQEPVALLDENVVAFREAKVPIAVCLGHLEHLTEQEFEDLRNDIGAETIRRNAARVKED